MTFFEKVARTSWGQEWNEMLGVGILAIALFPGVVVAFVLIILVGTGTIFGYDRQSFVFLTTVVPLAIGSWCLDYWLWVRLSRAIAKHDAEELLAGFEPAQLPLKLVAWRNTGEVDFQSADGLGVMTIRVSHRPRFVHQSWVEKKGNFIINHPETVKLGSKFNFSLREEAEPLSLGGEIGDWINFQLAD